MTDSPLDAAWEAIRAAILDHLAQCGDDDARHVVGNAAAIIGAMLRQMQRSERLAATAA